MMTLSAANIYGWVGNVSYLEVHAMTDMWYHMNH